MPFDLERSAELRSRNIQYKCEGEWSERNEGIIHTSLCRYGMRISKTAGIWPTWRHAVTANFCRPQDTPILWLCNR